MSLRGVENEPNLAASKPLYVFRKPIQVQDQIVPACHILTDLIDDEDDVLFAALGTNNIDHILDALVFELEKTIGAG